MAGTLANAVKVLQQYGKQILESKEDKPSDHLIGLLEEVRSLDEPKVLAIANTLRYLADFDELVRDNVEGFNYGQRYNEIDRLFTSIREDLEDRVKQTTDGKYTQMEKLHNFAVWLIRKTPHARFEQARKIYLDVQRDVESQIEKETTILEAYKDFRGELLGATGIAEGLLKVQRVNLENALNDFNTKSQAIADFKEEDGEKRVQLEKERDNSDRLYKSEQSKTQLLKDMTELMSNSYHVGEALVANLDQTHGVKKQVWKKSVEFFGTSSQVYAVMDAAYSATFGLDEAAKTLERFADAQNKGIEQVAKLGSTAQKAALQTAYKPLTDPAAVKTLVDSIVEFQTYSVQTIDQLNAESTENAAKIADIVNGGKEAVRQTIIHYRSKLSDKVSTA